MKELQQDFFNVMEEFRKLNIASLLPDMSHGDFAVLKAISMEGRCRGAGHPQAPGHPQTPEQTKVSQIVRCLGLPPPAISRSLRGLEQKGYIRRRVDEGDRRNTFVMLTALGESRLMTAEETMSDFAEAVFEAMGEDTMERLNGYLHSFVNTAKKEIENRKIQGKKGDNRG
jgi:DNA-binding MarR family transcriptional regulator